MRRPERIAGRALGEARGAVGADQQRRRVAGGREPHRLCIRVDEREEHGRGAARLELLDEPVHPLEDQRGPQAVERVRPHGALEMRHARGRLDAAADDVSDHEREPPVAERDRVVPVPADAGLARAGDVAGGEAQPGQVGQLLPQQAALERLGRRALDLHLLGRATQALERGPEDRVPAGVGRPGSRPRTTPGRRRRLVFQSPTSLGHPIRV